VRTAKSETIFLVLAALFGFMLIIVTPPFQNPDEHQHFFRAYQISQGIFLPQQGDEGKRGVKASQDFIDLVNSFEWNLFDHPDRKTSIKEITKAFSLLQTSPLNGFFELGATKFYPPLPYAPQAFFILFGRLLPIPALSLLYLGRLASLGCWMGLVWISLRLLSYKKWLFFYLAFTPMAMVMGSALSVDTVTNGLGFLWISLCLNYALNESVEHLYSRQKLLLLLVASCLGLAKQSVIPIVLCLFAIPKSKWGTWKSFLCWTSIILLASFSTFFVWYLTVRDFTVPDMPWHPNPKEQLGYMVGYPSAFLSAFLSTHLSPYFISNMITQYIGQDLGTLDAKLPLTFVAFYLFYTVVVCFNKATDVPGPSLTHRLVFLSAWILSVFLIATLMYLHWTPVGGHLIEGPMGRYYIMSGPAFFIAISGWLKVPFDVNQKVVSLTAFLFGSLTIVVTIGSLIVRYY
jgi:uncharacterized membrane protein